MTQYRANGGVCLLMNIYRGKWDETISTVGSFIFAVQLLNLLGGNHGKYYAF